MRLYFDPMIPMTTITLVGLGGTGSQLARILARLVFDMRERRLHPPQLRFIDPDRVEARNCGRQLYTPADIGQYKAEVLGKRFNRCLGLDIEWITQAVDAERHFERYSNVVIGAVDNHLARRELARIPGVWLDVGNHYAAGQVCIGSSRDWQQIMAGLETGREKTRWLPNAALLFPSLLEPEPVNESTLEPASCSDRVIRGEQHLLINDLVATIAGGYLYKLLHQQPIETFLSYISLDSLTVRSLALNRDEMLPYMS